MKLQNDKYEIEIKIDEDFHAENDGQCDYDYVFGLEKVNEFYDADLDSTLSVNVKAGDKAVKIALTGENYSFDRNCAVLEDDRIKLRDFQNNYYEINFDGKLIKNELLEHRER